MHETFMCSVATTPALEGLSAPGRSTNAVTFDGDKAGEHVSIYGIPTNEPFNLLPTSLCSPIPCNVSGLEAEVVDKKTLKIVGFSPKMSLEAQKLEPQVTGTIVREGPRVATKEPIIV